MMTQRSVTPVTFFPFKYGRPLAVDSSRFREWTGIVPDGHHHVLDFHELLVVSKGAARIDVNGGVSIVEGPALFFTPPHAVRRVELIAPMELELVVWSDRALRHGGWISAAQRMAPGAIEANDAAQIKSLAGIARRMQTELREPRADSGLLLDALLTQFLVTLNRCRLGDEPTPLLVDQFETLLESGFRRHHRVSHYAAALRITADYLSALVRAHRGVPAKTMINRRLFNEAARLLTQTSTPVTRIAVSLGFDEPSHFTRFFTRMTGAAPTDYRRRVRDHGIRQVRSGN